MISGDPTKISPSFVRAVTPIPGIALKFATCGISRFASLAASTIDFPIECSDFCSSAALFCKIFSLLQSATGMIFVTPNLPLVKVPVLSNMTTVHFLACSNCGRFCMRSPFFAARVETRDTTSGIARPSA